MALCLIILLHWCLSQDAWSHLNAGCAISLHNLGAHFHTVPQHLSSLDIHTSVTQCLRIFMWYRVFIWNLGKLIVYYYYLYAACCCGTASPWTWQTCSLRYSWHGGTQPAAQPGICAWLEEHHPDGNIPWLVQTVTLFGLEVQQSRSKETGSKNVEQFHPDSGFHKMKIL